MPNSAVWRMATQSGIRSFINQLLAAQSTAGSLASIVSALRLRAESNPTDHWPSGMRKNSFVEEFGTRWPIAKAWRCVEPGVFEGESGVLTLATHDGGLIDPARCRAAEAVRPAAWSLAQTRNGIAVSGEYRQADATVRVYSVRIDESNLKTSQPDSLPELQATYVVADSAAEFLAQVVEGLDEIALSPTAYGTLDQYGHAAMGPVPIASSWKTVGEHADDTPVIVHPVGAYPLLVGGGWLMLADEQQCCGVMLQPLGWRRYDAARADLMLRAQLSPRGLTARLSSNHGARVWKSMLSRTGASYSAYDSAGQVRAVGAFWEDSFSQPWRLHYWLDPTHGGETEQLLAAVDPDSLGRGN